MFNINLKNRRLICGLSQKQVADYLNITPQSVSKWERGDALPSIDYLPKLSECLDCDINAFFKATSENNLDIPSLIQSLKLLNELENSDNKKIDKIEEFVREDPSRIENMVQFCNKLKGYKTLNAKKMQGILCCTEPEANELLMLLLDRGTIEKLDIEDMYFIGNDSMYLFAVLLNVYLAAYERSCNENNFDFKKLIFEKIDHVKSNFKNN